MRGRVSTGSLYEKELGYSRAVRIGDTIHVSGCSGLLRVAGQPEGSAAEQFMLAAHKLHQTLKKAGGRIEDVVMTRVYITRSEDWQAVGHAHGRVFGEIRPASTMVQVCRLIDGEMLVEVEAVAIVAGNADPNAGIPESSARN